MQIEPCLLHSTRLLDKARLLDFKILSPGSNSSFTTVAIHCEVRIATMVPGRQV